LPAAAAGSALADVSEGRSGMWWQAAEPGDELEWALEQINSTRTTDSTDAGVCRERLSGALHTLLDSYRRHTQQLMLNDTDALCEVLTKDVPLVHQEWLMESADVIHLADFDAADGMRTLGRALYVAQTSAVEAVLDVLLDFPNTRLAAYGTLRPGESNFAMLADVEGIWVVGTVRGTRFVANGFPAFNWRASQEQVPVSVLTSAALAVDWARLDDFEGRGYCRILVPVRLPNRTTLVASL
jgi:gamma-glutamylcyclotransferase (GGCT)/AIG2-like uncharacterized protein YtfP